MHSRCPKHCSPLSRVLQAVSQHKWRKAQTLPVEAIFALQWGDIPVKLAVSQLDSLTQNGVPRSKAEQYEYTARWLYYVYARLLLLRLDPCPPCPPADGLKWQPSMGFFCLRSVAFCCIIPGEQPVGSRGFGRPLGDGKHEMQRVRRGRIVVSRPTSGYVLLQIPCPGQEGVGCRNGKWTPIYPCCIEQKPPLLLLNIVFLFCI